MKQTAGSAPAGGSVRIGAGTAHRLDFCSGGPVFKGTALDLDDVDFVIDSGSDVLDGRSISNCGFLGAMGAHHKEESRVEGDGLYGAMSIASGAASVGLIIAYSKPSESDLNAFYATQCEPFYARPVGFDHRVATGLRARRYLADRKFAVGDLARLVVRRWTDAAATGRVQTGRPLTESEVIESDNAAAPLTQLMMSRPADGAVAVLIAAGDVARRAARSPAWISGLGTSAEPGALDACAAAATSALKHAGRKQAAPADCGGQRVVRGGRVAGY
jgi:acetyl-CoA C-acetyltransferase